MSVSKRKKVEYKNAFDTHVSLGYKKFSDLDVSHLSHDDQLETFWYTLPRNHLSGSIALNTSYESLCKTFGLPIKVNGLEAYNWDTPLPLKHLRANAVEYSNAFWIIILKDMYAKSKPIGHMCIIRNHGDNLQCKKKLEELTDQAKVIDKGIVSNQYRLDGYKKELPEPFVLKKLSETKDWKLDCFCHWDNSNPYYRAEESYLDTIQYYLGENK
jgi:hypothetical protein